MSRTRYLRSAGLAPASDHHHHARSVVRQQTRHGDQPRAQWRKLWRHCRGPSAVVAIEYFGFAGAMVAPAAAMVGLMIPVVLIFVGRPPALPATAAGSSVVELPSA